MISRVQVRVAMGDCSWVAHGRGGVGVQFLGQIRGIGLLLRKNGIENGSRADPRGSNPHSYGDSFSESGAVWASQKFREIRMMLRVRDSMSMKRIMFIALLWGYTRF